MSQDQEIDQLQRRAMEILAKCDARNVPILLPSESAELAHIDYELTKLGACPIRGDENESKKESGCV